MQFFIMVEKFFGILLLKVGNSTIGNKKYMLFIQAITGIFLWICSRSKN